MAISGFVKWHIANDCCTLVEQRLEEAGATAMCMDYNGHLEAAEERDACKAELDRRYALSQDERLEESKKLYNVNREFGVSLGCKCPMPKKYAERFTDWLDKEHADLYRAWVNEIDGTYSNAVFVKEEGIQLSMF